MSAADDAFVRHKSRHAVTWALVNIQRLHKAPSAMNAGTPLDSRTALICGASHSLTKNGHLIGEAQKLGATVFATNSSDVVLRSFGVDPDVTVVRESIDIADFVASSKAHVVAVDICAHPDAWSAAGDRLAWFIPGYPRHFQITQRLGVRPLFGGTSAFTSAVALAIAWGADRVILVGADLGLTLVDGVYRGYHPAAPRGDWGATIHDNALHITGNAADDERCVRVGQPPPGRVLRFHRLPAADWSGTLPSLDTLVDEKIWLETQAERHGKRLELLNCTEGGAGIVGWEAKPLHGEIPHCESEWNKWPSVPRCVVDEAMVQRLLRDMIDEARALEGIASRMLGPQGPDLQLVGRGDHVYPGAPLAESLAAWRTVDAPHDAVARCRFVYGALAKAAAETQQILSRGSHGSDSDQHVRADPSAGRNNGAGNVAEHRDGGHEDAEGPVLAHDSAHG